MIIMASVSQQLWLFVGVVLCLLTVGHRVGAASDGKAASDPKPAPTTCNTTMWDSVRISIPSVPEVKGGPRGSVCNETYIFVEDIVWRCKKRYCCEENCNCDNSTLTEQPCMVTPPQVKPVELVCLVQHKLPPRFYKRVCCEGFEEIDRMCFAKINCDVDGGGCDQDCVKGNTSHVCTCGVGYQLSNRTKCREIPVTTTTSTSPTTISTPTTIPTTSTTMPTTISTPTTIPTTPTTTPTTTSTPTTIPSSSTTMPTTTSPTTTTPTTIRTPSTTSPTTTRTTSTEPSTTRTVPGKITRIPVPSTTTQSPTTTREPENALGVGKKHPHGPPRWMMIVFPLLALLLILACLFCFFCRKRKPAKPLYVKHDDEPTMTYDNETYGRAGGATAMDIVLPMKSDKKKKKQHPFVDKVLGVKEEGKSVKIIENDLYRSERPYGKEPKVMYGNYVNEVCKVGSEDDDYLVAMSVYASGLPPPYVEEEPYYEPVGQGAVGPLPIKEPLQGMRTAEIENTLNDNMEDIYSEIP